jgi:hypothetical protein
LAKKPKPGTENVMNLREIFEPRKDEDKPKGNKP